MGGCVLYSRGSGNVPVASSHEHRVKLCIPQDGGNLTSWASISFSRMTLISGVCYVVSWYLMTTDSQEFIDCNENLFQCSQATYYDDSASIFAWMHTHDDGQVRPKHAATCMKELAINFLILEEHYFLGYAVYRLVEDYWQFRSSYCLHLRGWRVSKTISKMQGESIHIYQTT